MKELATWEDGCVDEIVTSIPFSDHYEYSPLHADFGKNEGDDGFFQQFDYLVPQLHRVFEARSSGVYSLKDRIQYGTMTGHAMYSVNPFSDKTVASFQKHGFIYGSDCDRHGCGAENAQRTVSDTQRTPKDSTKMSCGSTEFVCCSEVGTGYVARQTANGPDPVTKDKSGTRGRSGRFTLAVSGGFRQRSCISAMLKGMTTDEIYAWWRSYCRAKQI